MYQLVTFQHLMGLMLAGLQWSACLVYFYDNIIMDKLIEEYLQNLQQVFERLKLPALSYTLGNVNFWSKKFTS